MLLGVRPELGNKIVSNGYKLRIYVPFGEHWYAYSMRRFRVNLEFDFFGKYVERFLKTMVVKLWREGLNIG